MTVPIKIKFSIPKDMPQHIDRLNSAFEKQHETAVDHEKRIAALEAQIAKLLAAQGTG